MLPSDSQPFTPHRCRGRLGVFVDAQFTVGELVLRTDRVSVGVYNSQLSSLPPQDWTSFIGAGISTLPEGPANGAMQQTVSPVGWVCR